VTPLTHLDFVDALRREAAELGALFAPAELSTPVPPCPGWTIRDLVEHLGGVQRWTTEVVRTGEPAAWADAHVGDDLAQWFDDGAARLASTLAETDPGRACWTMAAPHEVVFWSRRQAHEAMIHRWDLAVAVGARADLDPALALDGIDEAISTFFPRQVRLARQPPLTDAIAIVDAVSGRRWVLAGDGSSTDHDSPAVDATVSGDAGELVLLLWQRTQLAGSTAEVTGDRDAASRVLSAQLTP
jgi:uncharacterized protein (TIGR03083 family)